MKHLMFAAALLNPATGDNTDLLLKILIVVGILCVLCLGALVILPKFSKKKDEQVEEVEVINQDE